EQLLSAFDVDAIRIEAMLWQTGYLTIHRTVQPPYGPAFYDLGFPNAEVRQALNQAITFAWLPNADQAMEAAIEVHRWFSENDQQGLQRHFEALYAGIPHDWYRNNPIAQYEGYYASVFYSHLAALGLDIAAEDVTSQGRCDLAVRYQTRVYLFEFKVIDGDSPTGEALAQLRAKDYAAKYRNGHTEIIEVGIEFSRSKRQIVGWQMDRR
ncbi:PD-(D/E)XK nuclease domain-containing protein, partial [Desulfatirhabdium butyrativorans]|uniref:PD-(D/E)XK nuclease domain-containing protein n=1 Tax=Desulfatirhabdium butyrativorans TaxID=340467 RepID=UPI00048A342E